jgi:hypothetical protein
MRLRIVLLSVVALVCLGKSAKAGNDPLMCLPEGINATDIVSTRPVRSATGGREILKTTVAESLKAIKARCTKKKLVDETGKEIRFYKLTGCWGIELPDQREVLDRQRRELADLKKCYRVIEMTCNPTGEQIPAAPPR